MGPWDRPSWAHAFHTAFMQPGKLPVTADDLDFPGSESAVDGLAMDLMLEEDTQSQEALSRYTPLFTHFMQEGALWQAFCALTYLQIFIFAAG